MMTSATITGLILTAHHMVFLFLKCWRFLIKLLPNLPPMKGQNLVLNITSTTYFFSWTDAGWRVLFNKLANFNWLGKVRKTKLYHNTEDVINR